MGKTNIGLFIGVSIISLACYGSESQTAANSVFWGTKFNVLDQHTISYIEDYPKISLKAYPSQEARQYQTNGVELMLAVSGGGARAAAFTLGVLTELENLHVDGVSNNILREVDYFSTVSGGGWGVSAYLYDRHIHNKNGLGTEYKIGDAHKDYSTRFTSLDPEKKAVLMQGLESGVSGGKGVPFLLGDIFPSNNKVKLPYLFSNATILTNQAPFVFTSEYFEKYKITSISSETSSYDLEKVSYKDLPVSLAVATSGSVPAFNKTQATSSICDPKNNMTEGTLCEGKNDEKYLTILDGGIYENRGVNTALELMASLGEGNNSRKIIMIIDADADTEIPFSDKPTRGDLSAFFTAAFNAGFAARTSSYRRLYEMTTNQFDIKTVKLSFADAADYLQKRDDYKRTNGGSGDLSDPMHGLTKLEWLAKRMECQDDAGETKTFEAFIKHGKEPNDCLNNNYYRVGLSGKTAHAYNDDLFNSIFELGRLVVRLKSQSINKEILQQKRTASLVR